MTLSTVIFLAIFYQTFQLNIGKKNTLKLPKLLMNHWYLQLFYITILLNQVISFNSKRELKVWKYIFNLFHFEMLIQNRNPKFRPLCLFVLTFHEYVLCLVFGWIINCVKLFCVLFMCYYQYKLNNSFDPR